MRLFRNSDAGRREPIFELSFAQSKQTIAIMDCIGRLIPQEGVDYDVEIVFNGTNDPFVSLNIKALTDKGRFWRDYVMKMMSKYPPTVENPPQSIVEKVDGDESVK